MAKPVCGVRSESFDLYPTFPIQKVVARITVVGSRINDTDPMSERVRVIMITTIHYRLNWLPGWSCPGSVHALTEHETMIGYLYGMNPTCLRGCILEDFSAICLHASIHETGAFPPNQAGAVDTHLPNSNHPGGGASGPHDDAHPEVRWSAPLVIQTAFHITLCREQVEANHLQRSPPSMTARGIGPMR